RAANAAELRRRGPSEPGRKEEENERRHAEPDTNNHQRPVGNRKYAAVDEQPHGQQGINESETAQTDAEKPDEPAIGVVAAMLHTDGMNIHAARPLTSSLQGKSAACVASD